MKENIIRDKSYQFSLQIIQTYLKLNSQKEYVLSRQLLRSGTSIGANIEEGVAGQSKKDFIAKLQISYKESKETHYWIRLLKDSNLLDASIADKLITDLDEIIRILRAILIKSKS